MFEKMMYYRLKSFLEKHDILHDSQYGFRAKRSTEHALLDIINQTKTNMGGNRPFPSSRLPPLQSESKCEVFVIQISFDSYLK